jgi:hypothetical protein
MDFPPLSFRYAPSEASRIVRCLNTEEDSPFIQTVETWVGIYLIQRQIQPHGPYLDHNACKRLKTFLRAMDKAKEAVPVLEATPSFQELRQLVENMARKPTNRPDNHAKDILLERLAEVYQQATGEKPDKPYYTSHEKSPHTSAHGLYVGKFLCFVEACLEPIDPDGSSSSMGAEING